MRQWIALLVSLWFASAFDSGAGSLEIDARSLSSLEASGARIHPSVAAGAADGALRFSDGGIEVPMGQLLSPQAGTVRIDFRTPAVWPAEGDQTLFHIGEEAHVLFVHHDAVKADKPFIEQADVLKKGRRPAAQLVP